MNTETQTAGMQPETKTRKNAVVNCSVAENSPQIWIFDVVGAGQLRFDTRLASEANRNKAEMHGWKQRISDAAAISRDEKTNAPATPGQKFDRMRKLIEHYESGAEEWSPAAERGGAGAEGGLLLRALKLGRDRGLGKLAGKSDDALGKFVEAMKVSERTKLLNSDLIRPLADELRAEMSAGVDADALLAGLEAEETES